MKVLYVQPGGGIGGSKISLYHMLKCAPAAQTSYLVLSAPGDKGYEELVRDCVKEIFYLELPTWQKYRRRTWQEKLRAPIGDFIRLLKLFPAAIKIKQIIKSEGVDLVHTNNSISAVGALSAWLAKIPHVWHIREAFGSNLQYHPILGDSFTYWLMEKLSNVIICNSIYTSQIFHKRQIPHKIIENGLDIEKIISAESEGIALRRSMGIQTDEIAIGMVGNLTTQLKRHDIFLEIAEILSREQNRIKFIVFGGSQNLEQTDYTRNLLQQATKRGIGDLVTWADFIPDTGAIMNCIDILVHPALTEGSGRVVMEAMAAGKPVVAMKSGGVQELIRDGETGFLVTPGKVQLLADKVKYLISHPTESKQIGLTAAAYALEHFSDDRMMRSITEIYEEILVSP